MNIRWWLGVIVTFSVLATSVGQAAAQAKADEPGAARKTVDKATPNLMKRSKVTRVDEKKKTFTAVHEGKEYTFNGAKLASLPKVGQIVDITVMPTPGGGPLAAASLNSSRSNEE